MFGNIVVVFTLVVGIITILVYSYSVGTLFKPKVNFLFKTLFGLLIFILIGTSGYCLIFTLKFLFTLGGYYDY